MKRKKGFSLTILSVIFAMILSACGSSDSSSGDGAESSGSTYDEIKERGKVVVGTEAAFEPFEFMKDGKIVGYGSDILAVMVDGLDVELEQLEMPFSGILPGLDANKYDFVATSVTITPERAEKYDFTVPIADGTMAVLKRKGDDSIKTPEDMAGKVVGTQTGSGMLKALQTFDEEELKTNGEGVKEIKEYVAFPEAYQELATGRIDAVINTKANLAGILKSNPDDFEIVDTFGEQMWIAWVVRKGDKELLDYLNSQILELRDSGKLDEMQMEWFGFTMEIPDSGYLPE